MKSLPTLIKLAQRNIDTIAIEISRAQVRIEELRLVKATSQAKGQAEQAMAMDSLALNMLGSMPAYMNRLKIQHAKIDSDIEEIEASIQQIRERLMIAYQEKSKLESLQTQFKTKLQKENDAKDQAQLDEAALTRRA